MTKRRNGILTSSTNQRLHGQPKMECLKDMQEETLCQQGLRDRFIILLDDVNSLLDYGSDEVEWFFLKKCRIISFMTFEGIRFP